MAENKEYITRQESMGTIQISEDVVASISSSVALETEGVGGLLNANMADLVGGKKMTAKGGDGRGRRGGEPVSHDPLRFCHR